MGIPPDIFIIAQHVEIVRDGVLNADCYAVALSGFMVLKSGRDQPRGVRRMRILNELAQKTIPHVVDGSFIGHGIDNDRSAIMVSRNHLLQLIFGITQSLGIFPLDVPVNRYLRPDHHSHLVRHAQHGLVVRIVRQPYKVTAQVFCPAQQRSSIVLIPGAAGPHRRFFMDVDSAQKNRRSVEQNIRALRFNRTKSDALCNAICLTGNLNLI